MHKCIMVKVGGKRNTRKVCKKQVNLSKTGGKFVKVGGKNNFRETGGKCTETAKIGWEIGNLWSMTKKRSSEILVNENEEIFLGKGKIVKISLKARKFFENRGNLK